MRYAAMAPSILTQRLCLQLRDECDAEWNHELLGEHEGGFTPFNFEVTGQLAAGDNYLVVEVNNARRVDADTAHRAGDSGHAGKALPRSRNL